MTVARPDTNNCLLSKIADEANLVTNLINESKDRKKLCRFRLPCSNQKSPYMDLSCFLKMRIC